MRRKISQTCLHLGLGYGRGLLVMCEFPGQSHHCKQKGNSKESAHKWQRQCLPLTQEGRPVAEFSVLVSEH